MRRADSPSRPARGLIPAATLGLAATLGSLGVLGQGAPATRTPAPRATAPAAPCPDEPARFHPCALAKAKTFRPPRTADGRPNLQGYWRGPGFATESIEAHPKTEDDNGGPSLIIDTQDGKLPYRAPFVKVRELNKENFIEPNVPCFPMGVPRAHYTPTAIQIQQTPGYVLIMFERAHIYRIIPTGGQPHIGDTVKLWMGDSRGRWEGNTLVVDVRNQNAKPWFDQAANFYSDGAHMVERWTLIEPNVIHYAVRVDDPTVFTQPFTMTFPIKRNTEEGFRLLEEACHEGDRNTEPLMQQGRPFYNGFPAAK